MGDKSKIEWTDATWNAVVGCSLVSQGCKNCYAMRVAHKLGKNPATPQYHGLTQITNGHPVWTGEVHFAERKLADPLGWRKPRMIFVNSEGDFFHKNCRQEWRDQMLAAMIFANQHTYQVLTKHGSDNGEMLRYLNDACTDEGAQRVASALAQVFRVHAPMNGGPSLRQEALVRSALEHREHLGHIWWGVSTEDQETADRRIPQLLQVPFGLRWISAEPLLGPVDISPYLGYREHADFKFGLDWCVAGGESGVKARPMHPDWARSLRDQCAAAGVPFFFKQWGAWRPTLTRPVRGKYVGGGIFLRPDGVWGQQGDWWDGKAAAMDLVGKKAAGRLLDGREWNEYPVSPAESEGQGA